MTMNKETKTEIVELSKDTAYLRELKSKYSTTGYYDLSIHRGLEDWKIECILKPFAEKLEKNYVGKLFEDHVEEPRVFVAVQNNEHVGWIELGYEKWNNRMRVWEFLISEEHRGKGLGTLLMMHAVKIAKEKGARMLVLETQTCNTKAIRFYLKFGFEIVGFDSAAYSNDDIEKKEARLEMGLKLTATDSGVRM